VSRTVTCLLLVLGVQIAWFASFAQSADQLRRIGILYQDPLIIQYIDTFKETLRELGYVEGRTISYQYRMARAEELQSTADSLVHSGVDLIVTPGTTAALAVQRTNATTPLIFYVADPVSSGLVQSLARPGGNATGIASLGAETGAKRLELIKELLPHANRVAVLLNPDNPITEAQDLVIRQSARKLNIKLHTIPVRRAEDVEAALTGITRSRFDAVVIVPDAVLIARNAQIAHHALNVGIPGIFSYRMFAEAGGLMSYGPDFAAVWRRCALYADKILKGAKPADLPVEQPAKFELIVNLKTAKAFGLKIPESILLRADEVIR
jgi:putative tryptophan/tyrosine transport system substrate-binding protein